jgi:hypothetical protein
MSALDTPWPRDVEHPDREAIVRQSKEVVVVAADLGELLVIDGHFDLVGHLAEHPRQQRALHVVRDGQVLLDDPVRAGELALLLIQPLVRDLEVLVGRLPERLVAIPGFLLAFEAPEQPVQVVFRQLLELAWVVLCEHFVEREGHVRTGLERE